MSGFPGLYKQLKPVLEATEGSTITPMWALLLYVAEPLGLRTCTNLEEARLALAWAAWSWNAMRVRPPPTAQILDQFFAAFPNGAVEAAYRSQFRMQDRRQIASIHVDIDEVTAAWRLAVTVATPIQEARRSSGP